MKNMSIVRLAGGGVTTPKGFRAGAVCVDVKGVGGTKPDIGALRSDVPAVAAGLFTTNRVAAAPVRYSKAVIAGGRAQGVIFNSGNANACTGEQGLRDAEQMAQLAG